jgi:PKD repeat protein
MKTTLKALCLLLTLTVFFSCEKKESDPPVTAEFSFNPANALAPAEITFTNSSEGATEFAWNFDDGATSTEKNPVHEYTEAGIYEVTLTAKNGDREDEISKDVTIGEPLPIASFEINEDETKLYAPATVTFVNTSQNGQTYSWDFGDGSTSTSENPGHTYSSIGSYTVTLAVTNTSGTDEYTMILVVIKPLPIASFEMGYDDLVAPADVTFNNTSQNGEIYSWEFGDGTTSTSENPPVHTYSTAGTFTVKLTVTNSSGTDTEQKTLVVTSASTTASIIPGESIDVFYLGDTWSSICSKLNGRATYYYHSLATDGTYFYHLMEFPEVGLDYFFKNSSTSIQSANKAILIGAFSPFTGKTEKGIGVGSTVAAVISAYGTADRELYSALYYDELGIYFAYDTDRAKIKTISIYEPYLKKSASSIFDVIESMKNKKAEKVLIR